MENFSWCRLCRRWVLDAHFETAGTQLGCGQGAVDVRYHPSMPRHGDVWRTGPDLFMVLDNVSPNVKFIGATYSTGHTASFENSSVLAKYLRSVNAELVNAAEEVTYNHRDNDGFSKDTSPPSQTASRRFIKRVLAR